MIKQLLTRKAKADALSPEIRQKYAEDYQNIVFELAKYAVINSLPAWDEDVNSVIVSSLFRIMSGKYDHKKPYIEWMCQKLIPEVDESFKTKDQERFFKCIQVASQQIRNV